MDIIGMTVAFNYSTGEIISPPESPTEASSNKQRRSRRKGTFMGQYAEVGMLSDRGDSLLWSADDGLQFPSDLHDGCW